MQFKVGDIVKWGYYDSYYLIVRYDNELYTVMTIFNSPEINTALTIHRVQISVLNRTCTIYSEG